MGIEATNDQLEFGKKANTFMASWCRVSIIGSKIIKWGSIGTGTVAVAERAINRDFVTAAEYAGIFGALGFVYTGLERLLRRELESVEQNIELTTAEINRRTDVAYTEVAYGEAAPLVLDALNIPIEQIKHPDTQPE